LIGVLLKDEDQIWLNLYSIQLNHSLEIHKGKSIIEYIESYLLENSLVTIDSFTFDQ
jgi:hypothetical protein